MRRRWWGRMVVILAAAWPAEPAPVAAQPANAAATGDTLNAPADTAGVAAPDSVARPGEPPAAATDTTTTRRGPPRARADSTGSGGPPRVVRDSTQAPLRPTIAVPDTTPVPGGPEPAAGDTTRRRSGKGRTGADTSGTTPAPPAIAEEDSADAVSPPKPHGPRVSIMVEVEDAGGVRNLGTFVIEIDETAAPLHAANFLKLVDEGFYNGTTFHRIVPGFIVQGGDPLSRADWRSPRLGTGSPTDTTLIPEPGLPHVRGAVAASRLDGPANPNGCSNASQFFICLATLPALDEAGYPVFGQVVSGMDVVELLARIPNAGGSGGNAANRALHRVSMKNVLRVAP